MIAKEGSSEPLDLINDGKNSDNATTVQVAFGGSLDCEIEKTETVEEKVNWIIKEMNRIGKMAIENGRQIERVKARQSDDRENLSKIYTEFKGDFKRLTNDDG